MKKFPARILSLSVLSITLAAPLVGCGDSGGGDEDSATTNASGDTEPTGGEPGECEVNEEISGEIEADTTWTCDKILSGIVTVKGDAVLTVAAGVTVRGKSGSALVVAQGSRLEAVGTKDAPIVFTSSQEEGKRAPGDWGGIVLLGKATTNFQDGIGQAEGLSDDATYGGDDPAYSCGTLKWVRVEFSGFELTTDNELNGITFYSCGTGTVVDYVQAHMGQDDGIEMFGGGFDAKHIVVTGAQDDSLDIDQGFAGKLQYVFIQQDPDVGNYGFEWSNQDVNIDATPRTAPKVANVTFIGTGAGNDTKSAGIKFKEGASGEIYNAVFTQAYNAQVDLTDPATEMQATNGAIKIQNTAFFQNSLKDGGATPYVVSEGSSFDLAAFVEAAANNNHLDTDPQLTSMTWSAPNIVPAAGSPMIGAGAAAPGFEATDFIGAVKDAAGDWTQGWTNFNPN